MKLYIKPLNDKARELYSNHGHFHDGDAGLDLYVLENQEILPGETKLIKLGISCQPEDGVAYFLFPRSSISKTPLRLSNSIGLIDAGYRGEIGVCLFNSSDKDFYIKEGELIGANKGVVNEIKDNSIIILQADRRIEIIISSDGRVSNR